MVQGTGHWQSLDANHVKIDNCDIGPPGEHHGNNLFTAIYFCQDLNVIFLPQ